MAEHTVTVSLGELTLPVDLEVNTKVLAGTPMEAAISITTEQLLRALVDACVQVVPKSPSPAEIDKIVDSMATPGQPSLLEIELATGVHLDNVGAVIGARHRNHREPDQEYRLELLNVFKQQRLPKPVEPLAREPERFDNRPAGSRWHR